MGFIKAKAHWNYAYVSKPEAFLFKRMYFCNVHPNALIFSNMIHQDKKSILM